MVFRPYIKNADGTLTEVELVAGKAVKDGSGNVISSTYATKSGKENLTNKTYEGYTLNKACAKDVVDSSAAEAIGTSDKLTTERDVYYGLPTINNKHDFNSNTKIFTPTNQLSATQEKRFIVGSSAVDSMDKENTNECCFMQAGHLYSNGSKVINVAMFVLDGTTLTITTN